MSGVVKSDLHFRIGYMLFIARLEKAASLDPNEPSLWPILAPAIQSGILRDPHRLHSIGEIQNGVQNLALIGKKLFFFRINHRATASLALAWTWLAILLLAGCAGSSAQLLAPARPAIDSAAVRIYRTPPLRFEEIAVLDATSGAKFFRGSPQGEAEALQRLREEAAKVGANGVLLTLISDRSRGVLGVGVGGGGISSGHRNFVAGEGSVSGGVPIVQNSAQGIAIYVFD